MDFLRTLLQRHLKAAWRRRWIGVAAAWVVCLAGWTLVATMPNQYQVGAELYVDTNAILTPLLAGIAVNTSPTAQLDILQRTLLSRPNIETLIAKTDLDLTATGPGAQDELIRGLQRGITLGREGDNLFSISYRNPQPQLALQVVQTLLSIFIERATSTNHLQMDNARHFLEHQIASYELQLRVMEARQTEFQTRYVGMLGPGGGGVQTALDTLRGDVVTLQSALQDRMLEAKTLQGELAQAKPMLVAEEMDGLGGPQTPLAQAEERLRMMKLQYTDAYPGVIALEQQIQAMKGEAVTASGKPGKGGAAPPAGTRSVPNPIYDEIKVKLVEVQGEISSIQRKLATAQTEISKLDQLQEREPNLVAEYDSMTRDYGVLRHNYDMLVDRLQSANIAEAADTQANKVQIQVIDPPTLPRLPVAPNRLLLVTGVLVAGLGAAVALPFLLAQLDRSFCTVDDLRSLGLPVLGGISLLGSRRLHQTVGMALPVGLAVAVLLVAYGGLVVRILRTSSVI